MIYLIVIALVFAVIILSVNHQRKLNNNKRAAYIKNKWAKPLIIDRNFRLISAYQQSLKLQETDVLSEEVMDDIDFEKIFSFVDRTNSKPGQQYLYQKLCHTKKDISSLVQLDQLVEFFASKPALRADTEIELAKLGHRNAYYIHELFTAVYHSLYQSWLALYIKIAGLLWIMALVLSIIEKNQYFFLLTLLLTLINFYVHYTNKTKISRYVHSLPQLYMLMQVAETISKKLPHLPHTEMDSSLKNLGSLKNGLSLVNFQDGASNDPTDIAAGLLELIKTLLLIEPLMFSISINRINQKKHHIEILFDYLAKIDVAISIQSLRMSLPYYTKPNFEYQENELSVIDLYHPVIENCVPNTIKVSATQGTLITGSNMSGKTTFIRSVIINALLSQTLFTSCSRSYEAPFMQLFSSIRIKDNLEENKSYFQAEALSILDILKKSTVQKNSLIIIDEIFRGTNTIERIAAAKAILSYLTAHQNFVFVSTHDLELAELLGDEYAIYSFEEVSSSTRLVFDYKIKQGILKNKNGIAILSALGYPQSVIVNAQETSTTLRNKYNL